MFLDGKQLVDVDTIRHAQEVLDNFNRLDLEDCAFFDNGRVTVPPGAIERFRMTGLSNKDFVLMHFHKNGIGL